MDKMHARAKGDCTLRTLCMTAQPCARAALLHPAALYGRHRTIFDTLLSATYLHGAVPFIDLMPLLFTPHHRSKSSADEAADRGKSEGRRAAIR